MNIAALSIGLSQMKLAQQASISVMKMAMGTSEAGVTDLLQMLQSNTKIMEQSRCVGYGSHCIQGYKDYL